MPEEYEGKSISLDTEARQRLTAMALADDRSESGMVRWLINQEWIRRNAVVSNPISYRDAGSERGAELVHADRGTGWVPVIGIMDSEKGVISLKDIRGE